MSDGQSTHFVAVIGAGPAGLFAAKRLAEEGTAVFLFNRDIKPGGLAEYGIYPDKYKMREGLRAQFRQVLTQPGIEYYGNVAIGRGGDMSLENLRRLGFQAVLVSCGAQGTKWLGLPGESLKGVYHAKDLVYHYNRLPPYSEVQFNIGRRVALIGAGNVMLDIAHYLIAVRKVDEVVAVIRRGPAEVKFTKAELEHVVAHLNREAFEAEMQRVTPGMLALGQDPLRIRTLVREAMQKAERHNAATRFSFRFLASPVRMLGDQDGRVNGLEVERNELVADDGGTKARGTGMHEVLPVDTVIFAIGDRVDETFGLPVNGNEFVKNPSPCYPVDELSYEAFDPQTGSPLEGTFVAGWSRKASTGLVGLARRDGVNGAQAVLQYLRALEPISRESVDRARVEVLRLGKRVVTEADLLVLEAAERARAAQLGLPEFKFSTNEEMLAAISEVHIP
ncbi:MAG TPA: FAD-dependent oxidoreductase [Anaerolineaceae bacterium]|nr:FAD-dependent oxidoreductase [Anaerolineaceae bacterium]